MTLDRLLGIVSIVFAVQIAFSQETASRQFDAWDKNSDGQLTREELPEPLRRNFGKVDADNDGFISIAEDRAFRNRRPPVRKPAVRKPTSFGSDVRSLRDIAYVENGHERHVLDLHIPADATRETPLVVFIHGGGWRQGNKDRPPIAPLLDDGFVCASINYRLTEHAAFPAQIHDCKAAIRWLRSNAETHGYDATRIGVWGTSAGGHLVALLGTSGDVEALEGERGSTGVSSRVQAVCDYFGPTDLLLMNAQAGAKSAIDHDAANSPESLLVGGPLQQCKIVAQSASPLSYVSADDPPFYIVHGDEDRLVPVEQSQLLKDALDTAGVRCRFRIVDGAGHGQFRDPEIIESVVQFFDETLRN